MRALNDLSKRLSRSLFSCSPASSFETLTLALLKSSSCSTMASRSPTASEHGRTVFDSPWNAIQSRGVKVNGSEVRVGNIIERKDRLYQVLRVDHSHEGRGKATIKVELRDVDAGNKVSQRFNTDETVEKVNVESKSYVYMCTDRDGKVLLMDPETLDQLEVSLDLFGNGGKYLQENMTVKVEDYNGTPLSAVVPRQVTCTVIETTAPLKGSSLQPRDKNAVLDNGVTVKVPPHILVGESLIIDSVENTYLRRAR